MNGISMFLFYVLSFWLVVNIFYMLFRGVFEKKGIKIYYGLALVYRKPYSPRSSRVLNKLSPLWLIPFILSLIIFYLSMTNNILVKLHIAPGRESVRLLIPGVNITGVELLYFALAVFIAAIIHELSHAYTARSHGLKTKNIGFALLLFIPIAFVEVDEEEMSKAPLKAKISTLAAGPGSNVLLGLLAMLLFFIMASPYGLLVEAVEPGGLADQAGIRSGMILYQVNNTPVTIDLLHDIMSSNKSTMLMIKVYEPGRGFKVYNISKPAATHLLGVYLRPIPRIELINVIGLQPALALYSIVVWFYIVNISLALINAAPIFVSDGGRLIYEVVRDKRIASAINTLTLIILVLALVPF